MRKLATVQTIKEIKKIENADKICVYVINGWQVVDSIDKYQPGDKAIFMEIDSWVPHDLAPFLSKGKEPREFEGVRGERLRTVKLRGELSQGLLLSLDAVEAHPQNDHLVASRMVDGELKVVTLDEGVNLTDFLGVLKWEAPVPAHLGGQAEGNFPSFIPKTDQERVQNCFDEMRELSAQNGFDWVLEEKMDGSSCTVFVNFKRDVAEGLYEVGICSRNFQLKVNDENSGNAFIRAASGAGYLDHIHKVGESFAIQGEVCGPGIQGNKYKLETPTLFVFDIYLIEKRRHATREERWEILSKLASLGVTVNQVPHLGTTKIPGTVAECLALADGKSKINPKQNREGIVFKSTTVVKGKVASFKAISNLFLLHSMD